MKASIDRDELRRRLRGFDARQQKIVGAMLAVMFQQPGRVREREWIAEQFTHVTLLAGEFEGIDSTGAGVREVQQYVSEQFEPLMAVCMALFGFVGQDLAQRKDLTQIEAMQTALAYFD